MDYFGWSKELQRTESGYKIEYTGGKVKLIRKSTGECIYSAKDATRVYIRMNRLLNQRPYINSKLATFLTMRDEDREPALEFSEI